MIHTQMVAAWLYWVQAVSPGSHVFVWQQCPGGKASFQNCLGASLKLIQSGMEKAAVYQRPLLYQNTEGLMNQDDSGCRARSNNGLQNDFFYSQTLLLTTFGSGYVWKKEVESSMKGIPFVCLVDDGRRSQWITCMF